MSIRDWEGVALIIGAGDIGRCIFDYVTAASPNMDVVVCGRNPINKNDIYLDLEDDHSFASFESKISLYKKPLRLVINTSGFLHSNLIKPEKRLSFFLLAYIQSLRLQSIQIIASQLLLPLVYSLTSILH